MGPRSRVPSFAGVAVALVAACSSNSTVTVPGKPQAGTYAVDFPTIAAAVASKSVTIYAFNPGDSSEPCVGLLQTVSSGALSNLPTPVQTISTSACGLGSPDGGALSLPYGTYAVLVVTSQSQGGAPFLYGCGIETISADSPSISVGVRVVNAMITVPTTNCTGLQAFCEHTCM